MKVLTNQTLYQCEYCSKRLLTKKGVELHETTYCKNDGSPCMTAIKKVQETCEHKNLQAVWRTMAGQGGAKEPDYDFCLDCNLNI